MDEKQPKVGGKPERVDTRRFPFRARLTGPTTAQYDFGGINNPPYELEEQCITGEVQMVDEFPVQNLQVHPSATISVKNLQKLLLLLRWKLYVEYEKSRLERLASASSPLEIAFRKMQSGLMDFTSIEYERALANWYQPELKPPPLG